MKTWIAAATLGLASSALWAAAPVGQAAPAFTAADVAGKRVSLADFKGRTVVLEWVNPGCPFVQKHYQSANMQATQKAAAGQGAVWLAVNTTAADHVDYKSPADMAAWMKDQQAAATHTLMDTDGRIGRAYGARTTPHMYVINASGTVVYAGAIDSKASANPADIAGATNHVLQALADTQAGRPVGTASTRPYGCSVKYGPAA
jgi:peroxiredoxin